MKAVILCAGKGTRMGALTKEIPKPMIRIGNRPILEHNIIQIQNYIDEIILVVGYKANIIKEYFGTVYSNIPIRYVTQVEQNGSGHALIGAKDFIKDEFLVLNGDDLYSKSDLQQMILYRCPRTQEHVRYAILAKEVEDASSFGVVLHEDGNLTSIIEKSPNPISNLVNTGAYLLDKSIFDVPITVSPRGEIELTDMVVGLTKKRNVKVFAVRDYWYPVNTIVQWDFAKKQMEDNEKCVES